MSQPANRPTAEIAKQSGILNGALVGLMWLLEIIDVALRGSLDWLGVHAWNFAMLWTLFTAPFAHQDFAHLAANSIPLLVLGFFIALGGLRPWAYVTLAAAIGSRGCWLRQAWRPAVWWWRRRRRCCFRAG